MQLSEIVTQQDLLPLLAQIKALHQEVSTLKKELGATTTDLTVQQVAKKLNCDVQTVRRHAKLSISDPSNRYALRFRRNTPGGKILIPTDALLDYRQRTDSALLLEDHSH
jgi:hypothetical protein